jgi:hypothetical protein
MRLLTRPRQTADKPLASFGGMIHSDTLKKLPPEQTALEMVTLDSLVPKDHLLCKIDALINLSFILDRVDGLYCADNGRPPLDPPLMFKALFFGDLLAFAWNVSWRARSRSMSPITGF